MFTVTSSTDISTALFVGSVRSVEEPVGVDFVFDDNPTTEIYTRAVVDSVNEVDKVESSRSLSINTQIGTKNYLHCTGVGKCILAYMPEDEQQHILAGPLKALTSNTMGDPRQLQAELRHIRADGYAMDNEEVAVALSCVAVPVFSAPGQVSCSISISGMTPRVRTALRGGLLDDLRQASADISRSLYGYQPADDLL